MSTRETRLARVPWRRRGRWWPAAIGAAVALGLLGPAIPDFGSAAAQSQLAQAKKPADAKSKRGGKRGRRGRKTFVRVDEVKFVPLTQTVPVLGRMVARQSGVVAARIAGPVARMNVQVGDRVKTGDVLAILISNSLHWKRELRAGEVAQYNGALTSARAKLGKAQNELRRLQNLRKSAAFSRSRFEDQQREVENLEGETVKANAELRQARANLKLAEINLGNATIRAPYPGVVTRRHTVEGAFLSVGAAVVTLVNDEDMEIEADVPSTRLGGLPTGAVIGLTMEDKTRHQAVVRAVVPDENPLARTRAVRLTPSFELKRGIIAANQTVELQVPVGAPREALTVHKDAIVQRGGGTAVYIVEGGEAHLRRLSLGGAVGGRFEVLDGLKPGDMAVVRGNERLRPGQRVQVRGAGK